MSGARGLIGGVVGLALLEVTVSNQAAAGRVGGIFTTATSWLSRWLDPSVPLIPDLRQGSVNPFTGGTGNGDWGTPSNGDWGASTPAGTSTALAGAGGLVAGLGGLTPTPRRVAATPPAPAHPLR